MKKQMGLMAVLCGLLFMTACGASPASDVSAAQPADSAVAASADRGTGGEKKAAAPASEKQTGAPAGSTPADKSSTAPEKPAASPEAAGNESGAAGAKTAVNDKASGGSAGSAAGGSAPSGDGAAQAEAAAPAAESGQDSQAAPVTEPSAPAPTPVPEAPADDGSASGQTAHPNYYDENGNLIPGALNGTGITEVPPEYVGSGVNPWAGGAVGQGGDAIIPGDGSWAFDGANATPDEAPLPTPVEEWTIYDPSTGVTTDWEGNVISQEPVE